MRSRLRPMLLGMVVCSLVTGCSLVREAIPQGLGPFPSLDVVPLADATDVPTDGDIPDLPPVPGARRTERARDRDDVLALCRKRGEFLLDGLRQVQARFPDQVKDVRGQGLMVGFELRDRSDAKSYTLRAQTKSAVSGRAASISGPRGTADVVSGADWSAAARTIGVQSRFAMSCSEPSGFRARARRARRERSSRGASEPGHGTIRLTRSGATWRQLPIPSVAAASVLAAR